MGKINAERMERLLKDHVSVIAASERISDKDKADFEKVAENFKKVAEYIETQSSFVEPKMIHELISFELFGICEDLVSEAPERRLQVLEGIQDMFLKMFLKPVRDNYLLYKLLWSYYTYWLKCWRYACALERRLMRKVRQSAIRVGNRAVYELGRFVNQNLEETEQSLKHEIRDNENRKSRKKPKMKSNQSSQDDDFI